MTQNSRPTSLIPDQLLNNIKKGDCVLFLAAKYDLLPGQSLAQDPPRSTWTNTRVTAKDKATKGVSDEQAGF